LLGFWNTKIIKPSDQVWHIWPAAQSVSKKVNWICLCPRHKGVWRSRLILPLILTRDTRRRCGFNFTLLLLYPPGKNLDIPKIRGPVSPRREIFFPARTRNPERSARGLVNIPTTVAQLHSNRYMTFVYTYWPFIGS
jgi:hypothetical protein